MKILLRHWREVGWMLRRPEDEDEEQEENEEHCDVVHRAQHDDELIAQSRHEPNQLQYPQQPECA